MKVRWNRNSLRLRITPPELLALEKGGDVREEIHFPGSDIAGWTVIVQPGNFITSLRQQEGTVLLTLGEEDRLRLSDPELEGVYFEVGDTNGRGNTGVFRYYIEKDFPCIHPRAGDAFEGPTETFPTPVHYGERK